MAKDLEYYLAQARRIEAHRDADFEKEIRKLYKDTLTDLRATISDAYTKYGTDDQLTFAILQQAGYEARFLKEIQERVDLATKMEAVYLRKSVRQAYELAYTSMVDGVKKASAGEESLQDIFSAAEAITPQQIKAVVQNPIHGLTLNDRLEKKRKDIIYNIKQTVGVGLMNGDRYTTMARRIAESLDGDYKKAIRIARTETHRVREAGNIDAAVAVDQELQNGTSEMRMVKIWKSMKDERVRPQQRRKTKKGWVTKMGKSPPNHMVMDGQTVLANELFDLGGGVKAMAPGQSGNAADDINCRCYVSYEMMDDDTYFKRTGKHFGVTPEAKALKREKQLLDELDSLKDGQESERASEIEAELAAARLDLMKARGIDPEKQKREIEDLRKRIEELQSSTGDTKVSLQKKVRDYDREQLKKAYSEVVHLGDETTEWLIDFHRDDTVQEFMDELIGTSEGRSLFKQKLRELAVTTEDTGDIARMQKLLAQKEAELAEIVKRYGLERKAPTISGFSQERKDAAYWFKGTNATKRADRLLRSDTGKLWRSATSAERQAAYDYTRSASMFNDPLRGFSRRGSEKYKDATKQLTNLIDRNPSKADMWLQRGVRGRSGISGFLDVDESVLDASEGEIRQLLLGKVVTDEAFVSASGAKGKGFDGGLVMNIFAPKGTKFIYTEPFSAAAEGQVGEKGIRWDGMSTQSRFSSEFEVLLQRGTRFKITKVEKRGDKLYIDVDVVGQI